MNEQELYARLGRQAVAIDKWRENYAALLNVFAGVVKGDIARSRVLINLTEQSWIVSEPNTTPNQPATFNGAPSVVVGNPEPDPEPVDPVPEPIRERLEMSNSINGVD